MKRKFAFIIALFISTSIAIAQKNAPKSTGNYFPDGTKMSEWFLDDKKTELSSLGKTYNLADYGIFSDPGTTQTEKIQAVIDQAANEGGGVVVIPEGIYKSGALYFKQGVSLHLVRGAMLLGSEKITDFPLKEMRTEGKTGPYFAALINVDHQDGFSISGEGTIDGNGSYYWQAFRLRRQWNPKCTNKDEQRPKLLYISNSKNVTISGVTLQNSPFWTSHFYRCDHVKVLGVRYFAPHHPIRSASTDGIDLDICKNIHIKGCDFTLNDDAICFKGGKGPYADKDTTNGPVENVLVENCIFRDSPTSCMTCGSEAIHVNNIVMRNCKINGEHTVFRMKMRPDTPQKYENILLENITGKCGILLAIASWHQFFDLQGRKDMPMSYANNVTLRHCNVTCNQMAKIEDNKQVMTLTNFSLEDIQAQAKIKEWNQGAFENIKVKKVKIW